MAQGASEASRQHCVNHGAISPQDHDGFRGRLFSALARETLAGRHSTHEKRRFLSKKAARFRFKLPW
jgi:hypothetical protein